MAHRREILLGVLVLSLVVVLWKNLFGPGAATGTAGAGGAAVQLADLSGAQVFGTDWYLLEAARPAYDPAGRNIFQFGKPPPPPKPTLTQEELDAIAAAKKAAEEERERQRKLAEERRLAQQLAQQRPAPSPSQTGQQTQAQTPAPPAKPKPPAITYKFIGYIGPPENKIAVLHDGTDLIFARRGEELDKGVRIIEIGYESIKFGYTDPRFSGESQTLPMSSSL